MLRTASVLFIIINFSTWSFGQKGTHSPYSLFGLGELRQSDYAPFMSMGGMSMSATDSAVVNHTNPATYSYIGRLKPIFQIGMNGKFSSFENSTSKTNQRHFGLNQFQLGIPIKKRWGAALGIMPYSFTGYLVSQYTVQDGDSTELFTSEGKGGVSKFYLGVAYQPLDFTYDKKKVRNVKDSTSTYADTFKVSRNHVISIGANANYLFGSTDKIRTFQFWSSSLGLNSKVVNSLRFSDLTYDFGVSYQYKWKSSTLDGRFQKGNSFSFGAAYSPAVKVRAFQDLFSYSYINQGGTFNGSEIISDTIEFINDNRGDVFLPESYKAGFEFRFGPKNATNSSLLRIGGDIKYQKWSAYNEEFGNTSFANSLKDRTEMAIGIEWTPVSAPIDRTPFLSKIHYRLGFNYTMTELQFETSPDIYTGLNSYGMSFGVGLPITIIRYSNTNINFGANLGNMGTTDYGLIKEKYIGVFFGISITPGAGDFWFLKRKYD